MQWHRLSKGLHRFFVRLADHSPRKYWINPSTWSQILRRQAIKHSILKAKDDDLALSLSSLTVVIRNWHYLATLSRVNRDTAKAIALDKKNAKATLMREIFYSWQVGDSLQQGTREQSNVCLRLRPGRSLMKRWVITCFTCWRL